MSVIVIFFALVAPLVATVAGDSATPDPTKYCMPQQYMVTQVGIEGTIAGGKAVGGMHRIFSAHDYTNRRFYTNYALTFIDTSNDRVLSTVGYEIIIDIARNAKYEIKNGECKKYPVPEGIQNSLTRCLSDKMKYQSSSVFGAYKGSNDAIRYDTFTMNLGRNDDDGGDVDGLTGQLSVSFVKNPDDPETYLQIREEMIGSLSFPQLSSNTISSVFSSDFVDYQETVDEAKFRVPDYCPEEYSQVDDSRSRRALSAKHFRLARYADVLFAYEL